MDQYINRAAREQGAVFPLTASGYIKSIPIWSEIYALEFLYNKAINKVKVTMAGKTVELHYIAGHIKDKLDRLYNLLKEEEIMGELMPPLGQKTNMTYTPTTEPQVVDVRPSTRFKG